ncbi:MAG TPA: tryptophan 7-halogenase [Thermoanaerobaculia bacterium]|nr:tryptophan 7-halogenase [Thermoanaerobaculia bacterium]
MHRDECFDVAILGAGIGGTMLAAILARQGKRVLVLEKGSHPRFAVGEALLPQSTLWMWILAQRFDVPEIQHLTRLDSIYEHVGPTCGIKRTLSFLYHEDGQRQDPNKSSLLIAPSTPLTSESHLFRQDVDLYMLNAAIRYGAVYRDKTDVREFDVEDGGVRLRTAAGEEYSARFLVDGAGFRSPLADRFGLRETPTPLETQSRSIFTHMEGMKIYDDCLLPGESPGLSAGWAEGTLHHVFEGGWFWIIPFNNVAGSENPLCSVGLTLNMKRYPDTGMPAEEEFFHFVNRFPSVAQQFVGATAVREWVKTGRLQYSATGGAGDRYFLMAHAHGFIDALYSRGMITTFEVLSALAGPLLAALDEDSFSRDRFAYAEQLQHAMLHQSDRVVNNSYRSFPSFPLFNAWLRVWLVVEIFGDLRLFSICLKYLETQDKSVFDQLEADPLIGTSPPGENELTDLVRYSDDILARYERGEMDENEGAALILSALDRCNCMPPVRRWGDPLDIHLDYLPEKLARTIEWGFTQAPQRIRERFFSFNPAVLAPPADKEQAA